MCSTCKLDPAENKQKLARQGAVDVDDFYDEVNYHPKAKKKVRKRNRCPGNETGQHVFVWTVETECDDCLLFYKYFGFYKYEYRVCCGCQRSGYGDWRLTEDYINKFGHQPRYGSPNPEFKDKVYKELLDKKYRNEWWPFKIDYDMRKARIS